MDSNQHFSNPVVASAQFIAEHAKHVSIDKDAVHKTATMLHDAIKKGEFDLSNWKKHPLNPKKMDESSIEWIFLVDTMNFSFWSDSDVLFTVSYDQKLYNGYWSLCAAINRAIEEGIPITSASYLASITQEQFDHIFRSETSEPISLPQQRIKILRDTGKVLLEKFGGSFTTCVKQAGQSVAKLLDIIVSNFDSYRDESMFHGRKVQIYKRAQILIADIWACFEGSGLGYFKDIDDITMFADYRVPQMLAFCGVLVYSPELLQLMQNKTAIEHDDPNEIEIRGCSIWSVELIKQELINLEPTQTVTPINSIIIDFYLWDYAKLHGTSMQHIPIHRTRTIFY